MKWAWVFVTVVSGTVGDLFNAKGMAERGEIKDLGPGGFGQVIRYIVTHRLVLSGIACDAISFVGLLTLLSTTELAFAVPVTALSNILKTALARWYLKEHVTRRRWAGAILVAIGIVMISL